MRAGFWFGLVWLCVMTLDVVVAWLLDWWEPRDQIAIAEDDNQKMGSNPDPELTRTEETDD